MAIEVSARALRVSICCGLQVALLSGSALAADMQWDPRVTLAGNYDSNYGLDNGTTQNARVAGGIVDAGLKMTFQEPSSVLEVTPRARSVLYPGHSQFQANDQFVDGRYSHDWRTANFSFYGDYWRQDVLRSYLPNTEIGTPLGQGTGTTDIGVINQKIRQDFLLLSPGATFDLSPRQRIEARAQYLDIGYSQQILDQREDFKNYSGSLGYQYGVTPQSTVTVRLTDAAFRPANQSNANTYGVEAEWRTRTSEVMQFYGRGGWNRTKFDQSLNRPTGNSVTGGVGMARKFQVDDLFVDYVRSVSPNSTGVVVVQDELRMRLEHEFGPRSSGYFGLRGIKEKAVGDTTNLFVDQRYGTAALGFEWRILREFSIVPEYTYTTRKDSNQPNAASSNAIMISLVYEPHRPVHEFGVRIGH